MAFTMGNFTRSTHELNPWISVNSALPSHVFTVNTLSGDPCSFPFVYGEVQYTGCTLDGGRGGPWCGTQPTVAVGSLDWDYCFLVCEWRNALYFTLKRKCPHVDEIFVIGFTESCQMDNLGCSQWIKCPHNDFSKSDYHSISLLSKPSAKIRVISVQGVFIQIKVLSSKKSFLMWL